MYADLLIFAHATAKVAVWLIPTIAIGLAIDARSRKGSRR